LNRLPRILPLVGVAVGGVLAINALAGAASLPDLLSGARAWAEDAAKPAPKPAKPAKADAKAKAADAAPDPDAIAPSLLASNGAATGQATDAAASALPPPATPPRPVCAPTAAELAKEAGLSPAELQQLQNLGARRTQLDQREQDLSTQLALLAAAEAKVDAKMRALTGLRTDVKALLDQANGREAAEVDRLVKVYEGMKPKDAAQRMAVLDDSVRLPIAAKMKERSLSAIVGQMPTSEAKKLTESLAKRFGAAQTLAQTEAKTEAAATAAPPAPPAADSADKPASPKKARPQRQAAKKKSAPADGQTAAADPAAKPAAAPTKAAAAADPAAKPAAAPAKAG